MAGLGLNYYNKSDLKQAEKMNFSILNFYKTMVKKAKMTKKTIQIDLVPNQDAVIP